MTLDAIVSYKHGNSSGCFHEKVYRTNIDSLHRYAHNMLLRLIESHPNYTDIKLNVRISVCGKTISKYTYTPTIRKD